MKRIDRWKVLQVSLFVLGILLCTFPVISHVIQWQYQKNAIATYERKNVVMDEVQIQEMFARANLYNQQLYKMDPISTGRYDRAFLKEDYENILDPYGNGVMGSIEIPSIEVHLPIYHGTDADVLSGSVGHIRESSVPIGGENTRSVLTGHRGSPVAQLFTRLDELVIGDLFYIHVLDETLAYKVIEISVIEPEAVENLVIEDGKDLVTLVTCTPYGINSHRLIITAERTIYDESEYDAIAKKIPSFRELIFILIPCAILGVSAGQMMRYYRSKKGEKAYGEKA